MGAIDDPKTRARFEEEFRAARPSMTLEEAADMIIANTDWHDGIPDTFGSATVDQLVNLVLRNQGPHLRHLVTGICRMPVPAEEREGIRLKMVEALRVVGKRSAVNRMRVERLGISMND